MDSAFRPLFLSAGSTTAVNDFAVALSELQERTPVILARMLLQSSRDLRVEQLGFMDLMLGLGSLLQKAPTQRRQVTWLGRWTRSNH